MGSGEATVKHVAKVHGGEIYLENTFAGADRIIFGTTLFWILTVPVAA